jgi:hypothetical protein
MPYPINCLSLILCPHSSDMRSARLLHARKHTQPSQQWLKQLTHKSRKLEERLYYTASNLDAYLDRSTLKHRLKKQARIITKQFLEAKSSRKLGLKRASIRSSVSSLSTAGTAGSAYLNALTNSESKRPTIPDNFEQPAADCDKILQPQQQTQMPSQQESAPFLFPPSTPPPDALNHLPFQQQDEMQQLQQRQHGDFGIDSHGINAQLLKYIMDNRRQQEEVRSLQDGTQQSQTTSFDWNNSMNNIISANFPTNSLASNMYSPQMSKFHHDGGGNLPINRMSLPDDFYSPAYPLSQQQQYIMQQQQMLQRMQPMVDESGHIYSVNSQQQQANMLAAQAPAQNGGMMFMTPTPPIQSASFANNMMPLQVPPSLQNQQVLMRSHHAALLHIQQHPLSQLSQKFDENSNMNSDRFNC